MARTLAELEPEFPSLRIERIALADHPELAERYGLLSHEYGLLKAHVLVIGGELAATGIHRKIVYGCCCRDE